MSRGVHQPNTNVLPAPLTPDTAARFQSAPSSRSTILSLSLPPPPASSSPQQQQQQPQSLSQFQTQNGVYHGALITSRTRSNSYHGVNHLVDTNGDVRDRYGYVVPDHLHQDYIDWRKNTANENAERERQYASILSSISVPYFDLDVSRLFRVGVPPQMRRTMWLQITGVGNRIASKQNYYEKLLQARGEDEESNSARDQIGRDLTRTFGANNRMQNEQSRAKLRNVLRCYARHNRAIGYSQSMNYLVSALLLLEFSEEEAFWMLDYIIQLMPDCYDRELSGMRADMEVLDYYVAAKLPTLYNFFLRHGELRCELYAMPMMMCWYVGYVPYETMFRIWDRIMYGGVLELFRTALKFLKYLERHIISLEGGELTEIMNAVVDGHLQMIDPDAALAKMPGNQRMEAGELVMRRMRIRERNRLAKEKARLWMPSTAATTQSSPSASTQQSLSPPPQTASPTLSRSSSLLRAASLKSATASAALAAAAAAANLSSASSSSSSSSSSSNGTVAASIGARGVADRDTGPKVQSSTKVTSGAATLRLAEDMEIGDDEASD